MQLSAGLLKAIGDELGVNEETVNKRPDGGRLRYEIVKEQPKPKASWARDVAALGRRLG